MIILIIALVILCFSYPYVNGIINFALPFLMHAKLPKWYFFVYIIVQVIFIFICVKSPIYQYFLLGIFTTDIIWLYLYRTEKNIQKNFVSTIQFICGLRFIIAFAFLYKHISQYIIALQVSKLPNTFTPNFIFNFLNIIQKNDIVLNLDIISKVYSDYGSIILLCLNINNVQMVDFFNYFAFLSDSLRMKLGSIDNKMYFGIILLLALLICISNFFYTNIYLLLFSIFFCLFALSSFFFIGFFSILNIVMNSSIILFRLIIGLFTIISFPLSLSGYLFAFLLISLIGIFDFIQHYRHDII